MLITRDMYWRNVESLLGKIGMLLERFDAVIGIGTGGAILGTAIMMETGLEMKLVRAVHYDNRRKLDEVKVWVENEGLLTGLRKVIVVDSLVDSGDTMNEVIKFLVGKGFNRTNIRTAVMIKKGSKTYVDCWVSKIDEKEWVRFFYE